MSSSHTRRQTFRLHPPCILLIANVAIHCLCILPTWVCAFTREDSQQFLRVRRLVSTIYASYYKVLEVGDSEFILSRGELGSCYRALAVPCPHISDYCCLFRDQSSLNFGSRSSSAKRNGSCGAGWVNCFFLCLAVVHLAIFRNDSVTCRYCVKERGYKGSSQLYVQANTSVLLGVEIWPKQWPKPYYRVDIARPQTYS